MRTLIKKMTALLTNTEEWSTWLAGRSWFTFLCVCNPPCCFKCDALELHSPGTLSKAVSSCYCVICLSSENYSLFIELTVAVQWVDGQEYDYYTGTWKKCYGVEETIYKTLFTLSYIFPMELSPNRATVFFSASYNKADSIWQTAKLVFPSTAAGLIHVIHCEIWFVVTKPNRDKIVS